MTPLSSAPTVNECVPTYGHVSNNHKNCCHVKNLIWQTFDCMQQQQQQPLLLIIAADAAGGAGGGAVNGSENRELCHDIALAKHQMTGWRW